MLSLVRRCSRSCMMVFPGLLLIFCGVLLSSDGVSSANPTLSTFIRVPDLFPVLNTITNTTLGVVRGALRVVNRPLDIAEDVILHFIEEIRNAMKTGNSVYGIPSLEPYEIDRIDLNIDHEIGKIQGYLEELVINGLSDFETNFVKFEVYGPKLYLNLTFPSLTITGKYNITGRISDLFNISGDGPLGINITNFHVDTYSKLKVISGILQSRLIITEMHATIKMETLQTNFENFMGGDAERTYFYNKLISQVGPETIETLWPDMAPDIIPQVIDIINPLLENSALLRLLNPTLAIAQNLPINLSVQGG